MFDAILNGSLIYSEHYVSLATGRTPVVVFCFAYNTSLIDRNHKLTGDYLRKLTSEMSATTIFTVTSPT